MNARYLILLSTMAFLGFSGSAVAHPCQGETPEEHKHCRGEDPNPDVPAEYSAELTGGAFVFASGKLEGLTANRKGTALRGNAVLEMDPDDGGWAYIFDDCSALVADGVVTGFDVQDNNWSINYTKSRRSPDKIHITMRNLDIHPGPSDNYSRLDFDLDLHGENTTQVPFLPDSGGSSEFQLTKYKLWAGGYGDEGWFICNSEGGGWDDWPELDLPSTLVIERE